MIRNNKIDIMVFAKMKDIQIERKLFPIAYSDFVNKIYLIREKPILHSKILSYNTFSEIKIFSFIKMFYFALKLLIVKRGIVIVMGIYTYPYGLFAYYFGKIFKKKIIQNIVGADFNIIENSKYYKKIVNKSDIIVTRGNNSKIRVSNLISYPIKMIYTPPNLYKFLKIDKIKTKTEYDFIFIGDLVKKKNINHIFLAFKKICDIYSLDCKICIVGKGELESILINTTKELGIQKYIDFVGWQSNVLEYLKKSKCLILPSEKEGLPMVIIEAFNVGIPVIATDNMDISTIAKHGINSLLFQVGDIDMLSKYMLALLTDNCLYQRLKIGAEKFKEEHEYEFSIENITNIWNQIFKQLGLIEDNNAK